MMMTPFIIKTRTAHRINRALLLISIYYLGADIRNIDTTYDVSPRILDMYARRAQRRPRHKNQHQQ